MDQDKRPDTLALKNHPYFATRINFENQKINASNEIARYFVTTAFPTSHTFLEKRAATEVVIARSRSDSFLDNTEFEDEE